MTMTTMKRLYLLLLQCLILFGFLVSLSAGAAFQAGTGGDRRHLKRTLQQQHQEARRVFECVNSYSSLVISSHRPSTTALFADKKQQKKKPSNVDKSQPQQEKLDGLRMFLAYATPWRNPNSIFVYMLLILYVLGKYSEAKSAYGGAL